MSRSFSGGICRLVYTGIAAFSSRISFQDPPDFRQVSPPEHVQMIEQLIEVVQISPVPVPGLQARSQTAEAAANTGFIERSGREP